jgi:hypothetical protein
VSGLVVATHLEVDGVVVYDAGTVGPDVTRDDLPAGTVYLVLRGPSYTGLRRILNGALRADAIVTVTEPGRALTSADVREVTGIRVIDGWNYTAATARAVDAGLLAARRPTLPAALTGRAVAPVDWETAGRSPAPGSSERGRRLIDQWWTVADTAPSSDIDPPSP